MSKLVYLANITDLDYKSLGLKCGIEIHQQLNTGKLFCSCPTELAKNEDLTKQVKRTLRFSRSETGDIDAAALAEFKKGKYNIYKYNDVHACLVDLDEEPPKGPNEKALDTVLQVSMMLNMKLFERIQFMRKLIVDGSITSGFQRTSLVAIGGSIKTSKGIVKLNAINLEEDSCRTLQREETHTVFALDRQGIPLIELTTAADIRDPQEAQEAALQIGNILRSFSTVKRGLGTIRQDLNVSIEGGSRIEIKGVQNLKMIPEIIDNEIKRQISYISLLEELAERKVNVKNFSDKKIYNVTRILEKSTSKIISDHIKKKDDVLAIKLIGFRAILGHELQKGVRFATEVSDRNKKHFPEIKGLFHTDELPNYGITKEEVESVANELKLGKDDAFIIIAQKENIARKSLEYVLSLIEEMIQGIPSEVRQVDPKGVETRFLRPMPGSARMYPETDIPEVEIDIKKVLELSKQLPELYEKKLGRISKELSLEENKVEDVLSNMDESEFKNLLKISAKSATSLYSILYDIPKDIKRRDGIEVIDLRVSLLEDLLKITKDNNLNSQTIRDIFLSLYKDQLDSVDNLTEYLEKKGLLKEMASDSELEEVIKKVIEENKGAPMGALMGHAMKALNGKADGKKVSELLRKFM